MPSIVGAPTTHISTESCVAISKSISTGELKRPLEQLYDPCPCWGRPMTCLTCLGLPSHEVWPSLHVVVIVTPILPLPSLWMPIMLFLRPLMCAKLLQSWVILWYFAPFRGLAHPKALRCAYEWPSDLKAWPPVTLGVIIWPCVIVIATRQAVVVVTHHRHPNYVDRRNFFYSQPMVAVALQSEAWIAHRIHQIDI